MEVGKGKLTRRLTNKEITNGSHHGSIMLDGMLGLVGFRGFGGSQDGVDGDSQLAAHHSKKLLHVIGILANERLTGRNKDR